jgi:hypothetical protein
VGSTSVRKVGRRAKNLYNLPHSNKYMKKSLSSESKPIDFDPSNLEKGMVVEFVYDPLIGKKRKYQCQVESTSERHLVALVLNKYPIPLSVSGNLHYRKRFAFKRMKICSISPQRENQRLSPSQLERMYLGEEGSYMDEHGTVR